MSKFTFICEETYGVPAKRTVEFDAVSLNDILAEVEMFLRGSGFYFHGTLDVVNDDCEEFIEDEQIEQSSSVWNSVVESLKNPPQFKASNCEVCGLNKTMMGSHNCYDDNCPVHAPKTKISEGC